MNNLKEAIAGYIGVALFIILVIIGLYIFSYILIIVALLGLVVYTITFIRLKFFAKSPPTTRSTDHSGRTIDHDPSE
tara:strand:- start:115 stop:345 length:231 start_codon:yes stop_codon:yes gene_type:complete